MDTNNAFAFLRAASDAGCRIQAWRLVGSGATSADGEWQTIEGEPRFSCPAHLYRVHPDDLDKAPTCLCPQHGAWIAAEDVQRNTLTIDVALNGDGAASAAKLCDIAGQVAAIARAHGPLLRRLGHG